MQAAVSTAPTKGFETKMPLDLTGNISLALSIAGSVLLFLGFPLMRAANKTKNLMRHGYLTTIALLLQTFLVVGIMVPVFIDDFDEILTLTPLMAADTWLHVAVGVLAELAGFTFVFLWLFSSRSGRRCTLAKAYMRPVFIVWLVAVVTGALIHLLEIL